MSFIPVLDSHLSAGWGYETAAHLLSRAGFGGAPAEIEALQKLGLEGAVSQLVDAPNETMEAPRPAWAQPEDLRARRMEIKAAKSEGDKRTIREMRQKEGEKILDLRHWWLERIMTSPAPLVEKMTLFWHGHFATSAQKVKNAYWLWLQNDTLRRHALGNFVGLAKAISRDPAMMIYLDLQQSRPEHPNENWARELMELFTIGIGHYTEDDVKAGARAFTGYRLNQVTQEFRCASGQHDAGSKTFMGRTGMLNGDDVLDQLTQQPACATFLARKLWRFFVEDEPSAPVVEALAKNLRAHNFEMRPALRTIFTSARFYSPAARRSQIKSPVQFLVQSAKQLETNLPAPGVAQNALRQMGQLLFAPPNVKGWDGGKAWISTSTLLFRYNFASYLISGDAMRAFAEKRREEGGDLGVRRGARGEDQPERERIDVSKLVAAELREQPEEIVKSLSRRLFAAEVTGKERATFLKYLEQNKPATDETLRELLHLMTSTPQFQLT